ncbi:UNVERIFIED_CONTAM: hypothetical protein K2H54_045044, partial [Gekko kuhli]
LHDLGASYLKDRISSAGAVVSFSLCPPTESSLPVWLIPGHFGHGDDIVRKEVYVGGRRETPDEVVDMAVGALVPGRDQYPVRSLKLSFEDQNWLGVAQSSGEVVMVAIYSHAQLVIQVGNGVERDVWKSEITSGLESVCQGSLEKMDPLLIVAGDPLLLTFDPHHRKDLIIMGAPGSTYWTGSIFVYNKTANTFLPYVDADNQVKFGSYLGYAVGAGRFLSPNSVEIVGGAPQQEQTGKAYIFKVETNLPILTELKGKKLGSYFGAAVCAVDLNGDGLSDLLVGAPMHSKVREEGKVYVYINSGSEAEMIELDTALAGSDLYAARFGESIANLGDIDNDGFEDEF